MTFAASIEISNLISRGLGSVSCCEIQYLTVVTSHENFGLVQESFKDLLFFGVCLCCLFYPYVCVRVLQDVLFMFGLFSYPGIRGC